jgi:cytochrome c oxidase subunit IV
MLWERLALLYAIVLPLLLFLLGIGALEGGYTFLTRGQFSPAAQAPAQVKH